MVQQSPASSGENQPQEVAAQLARMYPDAHCALVHRNAFELLIATILSAQTTDARVNTVTPELFRRYPDAYSLAGASAEELSDIVKPLGFQRRRGGQLKQLAVQLVEDHDGQVPRSRKELEKLPGVGRKTAHVVMGNAFAVPAITVDTHVGRLARRLGWSDSDKPLQVERDIAAALPNTDWTILCHRLIQHGREVCHSRTPECGTCQLNQLCPTGASVLAHKDA